MHEVCHFDVYWIILIIMIGHGVEYKLTILRVSHPPCISDIHPYKVIRLCRIIIEALDVPGPRMKSPPSCEKLPTLGTFRRWENASCIRTLVSCECVQKMRARTRIDEKTVDATPGAYFRCGSSPVGPLKSDPRPRAWCSARVGSAYISYG